MASINQLTEEAKVALITSAKAMVSVLTIAGLEEDITSAFLKSSELDESDLLAFAQVNTSDLDRAIVDHNGTSGLKKLSLGQKA